MASVLVYNVSIGGYQSMVIVLENGRRVNVDGRVAEIIKFVLARLEEIAQAGTVKIEHNCAGQKVTSRIDVFETETVVVR